MKFSAKLSDQESKNVENDPPIKEKIPGEDQSSEVKTKVSIVWIKYNMYPYQYKSIPTSL